MIAAIKEVRLVSYISFEKYLKLNINLQIIAQRSAINILVINKNESTVFPIIYLNEKYLIIRIFQQHLNLLILIPNNHL